MKEQNNRKASLYVLKRLLSYMIKNYRFSFLVVVVCIIIGAFATMQGMLFVQSLVDDYIVPLLNAEDPDFTPLARALAGIVIFYLIGIIASYAYNRIMVNVSQGTMLRFRDELFAKMESLPIKYFDTHAHGDIMSVYTNDVDTHTEELVQAGMDALMKGRTTFVIAHRLSTIKNADCIMVMEQGRIIERGSHDDLIAAKGKYYQLYTGNFAE